MQSSRKKNVLFLIAAVLCQFALLFGVFVFYENLLPGIPLAGRAILLVVCQWLFLIVPVVCMLLQKEKPRDIGFSREKLPQQILVGIGIGVGLCLTFTVLPMAGLYFMGESSWQEVKGMFSSTVYTEGWQFAYEFFYAIVGVGLAEEVFFRGYVFKKLLDIRDSRVLAIVVSSVLFGLFHAFQGNVLQMGITAIMGAVFCLLRERIRYCSLLSLVLAHGIYDALIVVIVSW